MVGPIVGAGWAGSRAVTGAGRGGRAGRGAGSIVGAGVRTGLGDAEGAGSIVGLGIAGVGRGVGVAPITRGAERRGPSRSTGPSASVRGVGVDEGPGGS